jgi:tripartite-type tricarboxylate transporter receptor subunit TctC
VKSLPEVPAIGETLAGYDSSIWHGVLAPRATPVSIVRRLNRDINSVLQIPEVNQRLASQGAEPVGGAPEAFGALIKSETAKYAKLLRDAGIRQEAAQR